VTESPARRGTHRPTIAAVMVAVFLAAVDQTIVATALPRISDELGEPALYAWVFTSYMIATTTFVPIAGTIGDMIGRRPLLLFGVSLFGLGSGLTGAAATMTQLIGFRAIQGIGAGVLIANAFALLGDIYPRPALARMTGIMSAVYGLAGAVGPLVGGLLTEHLGWRSAFWANVLCCALIIPILAAKLPRRSRASREPIDLLGAGSLVSALLPGLAALSLAGEGVGLGSRRMQLLLGLTLAFSALFVAAERRAIRPIVAPLLFRSRVFSWSMCAMFGIALAMYASVSYAPLLFQTTMGMSPTASGAATAPLIIAVAITAIIGGRLVERGSGFRAPVTAGVLITAGGLWWLARLDALTGPLEAAASMALIGAGLGLTIPTLLLAAQGSAEHRYFGATTALAKTFRSLGGLVGVAAAGAAIRYYEPTLGSGAAMSMTMLYAALIMVGMAAVALLLPGREPNAGSRRPR